MRNPILEELRQTRERLLAEAGGSLECLVAKLQRDERQSDREFISPRPRGNRSSETAKPGANDRERQASTANQKTGGKPGK